MKHLISVVIVTYNSQENIAKCLKSISRYLDCEYQIIVVDNNSTDSTIEQIKSSEINVELLPQSKNYGFSKANNIGVKEATGELLFFLNPDTEILDKKINQLVEYIQADSEVGIVAPKLKLSDGQIQTSVKKFPTFKRVIAEYLLGYKNNYSEYVPAGDKPVEVEAVYGAAILIHKDFYQQIGGFDNKFFLYYEDLDLCRKVHTAGKKIIYLPTVVLLHHLGKSTRNIVQKKLFPGIRTLALFIPMRSTGSQYYLVQSGNLYHGIISAFMIRLIIYLGQKLKLDK